MTPNKAKAEAEKIIKEHYEAIKHHLPLHGMTDIEMELIAESHSIIHVNKIIEQIIYTIVTLKSTDIDFLKHSNDQIKFYRSILKELERM